MNEHENKPLVSVMMTVYNDVSILPFSIESVLDQSILDWELLILDNSDNSQQSWEILSEYRDRDERIKIFKSPGTGDRINIGWPKGSSYLLEKATGKYAFLLAADDFLDEHAFEHIKKESEEHDPDVIWVGSSYTTFKDGVFSVYDQNVPEYRFFDKGSKAEAIGFIPQNVYYNSMFHYSKVSFLKEKGIDFFKPYYGDCASMTAAMCFADKMTVLDKPLYYLTINTTQTGGRVMLDFYTIFSMQWKLFKQTLDGIGNVDERIYLCAASGVFHNFMDQLKLMLGEAPCRDKYMNPLSVRMDDRIAQVKSAVNDEYIKDLFVIAGRADLIEKFANL